jgi:hypothetical protein
MEEETVYVTWIDWIIDLLLNAKEKFLLCYFQNNRFIIAICLKLHFAVHIRMIFKLRDLGSDLFLN